MKRTTDLSKVIEGHAFTWGDVIAVHQIGEYAIAEFYSWATDGARVRTGTPSDKLQYHGWIDGKSISRSWPTLDAALAGCIAYKHEGPNHRADYYFMKMLGAE